MEPFESRSTVNLNRLGIFAAVVEAGSFTAGAARLGLSKTVVTTHVQRLERELSAQLLIRTTRQLRLTEAGEQFIEAIRPILADTKSAIAAVGRGLSEPRGTLRVTAPIDYGASVVAPLVVELQRRHPGLKVDLLMVDRQLDVIAEGIDVAIRFRRLDDSSLRSVPLGQFEEWLVVGPSALPSVRSVKHPDDLQGLPLIAQSVIAKPLHWRFRKKGRVRTVHFKSALSVNTSQAARTAAQAGGGLAIMADFDVAADIAAGRLTRVLPDWSLPGGGIYAVFPGSRFRPLNTRVFLDSLRAHMSRDRGDCR